MYICNYNVILPIKCPFQWMKSQDGTIHIFKRKRDLHLVFEGYKVDHFTFSFLFKECRNAVLYKQSWNWQIIVSITIFHYFAANNNTLLNNVASVVQADIEAEDGVVHIISHVLIPSTLSPTGIGGIVGQNEIILNIFRYMEQLASYFLLYLNTCKVIQKK